MKRVITIALLFFTGCFIANLSAQDNISALIKKCEKMSSVDMSYIINKDPKTKKVINNITTITIKNDPGLVKEFIAAFEKDKDNAYSISGSVKNGLSIPSNYKFSSEKDNHISCTIAISDNNADASISYRESPNNREILNNLNGIPIFFHGTHFNGSWDMDMIRQIESTLDSFRGRAGTLRFNNKQDTTGLKLDDFMFDFEFDNMPLGGGGVEVLIEKRAK